MHETLSSLLARAFTGNRRPLEYYLREQSRLPGTRANLELVNSLSNLLTAIQIRYSTKMTRIEAVASNKLKLFKSYFNT